MKKISTWILIITMTTVILTGCNVLNSEDNNQEKEADLQENIQTISKAQKIELISVDDGSVLKSITETDDIETFINQLKLDEWDYSSSKPKDAEKQYEYIYYQEDTVKFGETKEENAPLNEVARLITYKDIPYITFKVAFIEFDAKVPDDVAKYLR